MEKTITDALQIDRQYKYIEKHKHMKKFTTMVVVSEHRNEVVSIHNVSIWIAVM